MSDLLQAAAKSHPTATFCTPATNIRFHTGSFPNSTKAHADCRHSTKRMMLLSAIENEENCFSETPQSPIPRGQICPRRPRNKGACGDKFVAQIPYFNEVPLESRAARLPSLTVSLSLRALQGLVTLHSQFAYHSQQFPSSTGAQPAFASRSLCNVQLLDPTARLLRVRGPICLVQFHPVSVAS